MFQRLLDDILALFFSIRLWSLLVLVVKWVTVLVSSATALIVCMLLIACYHERKTRSCLRSLATPRAVLPFLNQWIMIKYCSNPDSAGYGPLYFEVRRGYYEQFKKHGIYMLYSGLKPVVVVLRKDYVEAVLSSNTALDKGHQYSFLHSWLGTGLLTSGGMKWKARRRLIAPAFHLRILEGFTPIINSQSMLLRDILGRASRSSNGVDVVPKVNACTLNIICETIMGTAFNAQSNSESPYIKAVDRLLHLYVERLTKPFLRSEFIYKSSSYGREYKRWLDIANNFAGKVIAERKERLQKEVHLGLVTGQPSNDERGSKISRPLLDQLLIEQRKNPQLLPDEGILEEVNTFMFAGHDTTSQGISWTLFLIGHHPEEQQKIHDELDLIFGDDQDRHVTNSDVKQMKYLECVIKESHRVYAPVPSMSRTCEEPFDIAGVTLPKGTTIQIPTHFLNRDPQFFPRPEEFHPERFLPKNCKGRNFFAYIPFSAGLRTCVGQTFATTIEKIILANILRRYKLQSLDQRDEIVLTAALVLSSRDGLRIKLTIR